MITIDFMEQTNIIHVNEPKTIQPLTDLIKGLKVLEPFLKQHDFEFDNYENIEDLRGQITVATYINKRKKIIISYRLSIREVIYQYDNLKISHDFYLDQLGCAENKEHPDFQSDCKLLAFRHILNDFDFLVDDFFEGQCINLQEFSKLQDNVIIEKTIKARDESIFKLNENKIKTARDEFAKKNFKNCMKIYKTINENMLNELDYKVIEYSKKYI